MGFDVFPLRAILLQCFFVVLAIAIEASFLYHGLKVSRQTSVDYSVSLNLWATSIGWLIFFQIQPILPAEVKASLINYIFFWQLLYGNTWPWFIQAGLLIFFITLMCKIIGLFILKRLRSYNPQDLETNPRTNLKAQRTTRRYNRQINQAITVLWAHAFSHSFLLFVGLVIAGTRGQ